LTQRSVAAHAQELTLEQAREEKTQLIGGVEDEMARRQGEDRSFALKFILQCTFGAVFLLFAFMIIALLIGTSWDTIKEPANLMLEIIKVAALPLATFVLGQYFGAIRK